MTRPSGQIFRRLFLEDGRERRSLVTRIVLKF